jgi:hypothetical protein
MLQSMPEVRGGKGVAMSAAKQHAATGQQAFASNEFQRPRPDHIQTIQRRDFATQLDASGLILQAIGFPTKRHRDFVDAIQGANGGKPGAFERSHLTMASRCQHSGGDEAAGAYVRRELDVIEKHMKKSGYMPFRIQRGGGVEHKRTTYEDFLTPAANWAMEQARLSDRWRVYPGRALKEQIERAIELIPHVDFEHEAKSNPLALDDDLYIQRMTNQSINYALKAFDRVAENGGDDIAFAEAQAERFLRYAKQRRERRAARETSDEGLQNCHPSESEAASVEGLQLCHPSDDAPNAGGVTNLSPFDSDTGSAGRVTKLSPSEMETVEDAGENISKLDAALIYAGRGWRVFPCEDAGKKPRILKWQERATTDEATIREWWRKWPDANVGLAMGAASGLIALDVDPRHGGDASLTELIEQYGELPQTMRAATGGGGQHLLFQYPEGATIRNSASSLGEGLDVRGEGGFIIAPPSVHESGRVYEWLNATSPAPLPEWLLKLLTQAKQASTALPRKQHAEVKSEPLTGVLIPDQQRNTTLFKIACSLRGKGAPYEEIEAAVFEVYERRCAKLPVMDASELRKIAASAMRYQPNATKLAHTTTAL